MYGAGGHDRDREYHRSRGGCDRGRAWRCVLDVGLRVPWNGDSLRGDSPGDPVPGKRSGRRLDRGADDVSGKTAGMFMGGSSVRIVLHSGGIRDGQHGAGQRDRGDRILCVRDPGGGGGRDRCDSRRECAGRRRKADLSRGGAACPIVRRDLHGGSAGGDRFVCRTYSGSLFGDHGGCFFVPQCSGRDRGVRDLAMCQLRDRAGRVLK